MTGLIAQLLTWPTLGVALLVFGLAPGVALRLIVLFYPRGNPRRKELLAELYAVPRIERPFWVAEQLEVAIFEGLRARFRIWLDKRVSRQADTERVARENERLALQARNRAAHAVFFAALDDDFKRLKALPWTENLSKGLQGLQGLPPDGADDAGS
jgi:hypothetical protein